jgi:hypothetical protein
MRERSEAIVGRTKNPVVGPEGQDENDTSCGGVFHESEDGGDG